MILVSSLSQQLNEKAKDRVSEARTGLAQTTKTLTLIASLTTLIALTTIGFANFFVVERQINTRVARLTTAVLSIADGNTKYDVNVTGEDELGKIALALETFKLNAEELARSNAELEKFAYAAAHDLRSPLRAIQNLMLWTLEDDENIFSEEGRTNMDMLLIRIGRLNSLLTDLLEYSRVGQEKNDLAAVSLGALVQQISDLVDPENKHDITYVGARDAIETYITPLRHVLLNLISNSVKHHDGPKGTITVDAYLSNNRVHITVKDDGPGIAIGYHERVFGLFETLKPRDEVEGSGLGLSIIRKLLDHYKGSIRIVSNPQDRRGTSFLFDFPQTSSPKPLMRQAA